MQENRNKRTAMQQAKINTMLSKKKNKKERDQRRARARDNKYFEDGQSWATGPVVHGYSDKDLEIIKDVQELWRYKRFHSCLAQAKELIANYDIKHRYWFLHQTPYGIRRCSKYSGGDKWECYHYQGWLVKNGICRSAIVQELVYNFLRAISHQPVMSTWREEICEVVPLCVPDSYNREVHDLATFNLKSAERISKRRCAAILIQAAFRNKRVKDHQKNIRRGDHYGIRILLREDTKLYVKPGTEWYKLPRPGVAYTFGAIEGEYIQFVRGLPFDPSNFKMCEWKLSVDLTHLACPVTRKNIYGQERQGWEIIQRDEFHLYNGDENVFYEMNPTGLYEDRIELQMPELVRCRPDVTPAVRSIQRWYRLMKKQREVLHPYAKVIQTRWRMNQIKRMKPFYLVPLPTTDGKPYLVRATLDKPWKQKPSFRMVYFLINKKVITRDSLYKGGPQTAIKMDWQTTDMSEIFWDLKPRSSTVAIRRWKFGKDYSVRITKDVEKFGYKRLPMSCW